jgi:hypothetical protein
VGSSTSHYPVGLHGLLPGQLTYFTSKSTGARIRRGRWINADTLVGVKEGIWVNIERQRKDELCIYIYKTEPGWGGGMGNGRQGREGRQYEDAGAEGDNFCVEPL